MKRIRYFGYWLFLLVGVTASVLPMQDEYVFADFDQGDVVLTAFEQILARNNVDEIRAAIVDGRALSSMHYLANFEHLYVDIECMLSVVNGSSILSLSTGAGAILGRSPLRDFGTYSVDQLKNKYIEILDEHISLTRTFIDQINEAVTDEQKRRERCLRSSNFPGFRAILSNFFSAQELASTIEEFEDLFCLNDVIEVLEKIQNKIRLKSANIRAYWIGDELDKLM